MNLKDVSDEDLRANAKIHVAHERNSHPSISMGELIDILADLGLEKFAAPQKRTARQKPNSQAEVSRRMVERDLNVCTNCGSTYALQADHVIPRAAGGRSTLTNQRQLCRSCNQRAAIEFFGIEKMEQYLDPTELEH